MNITVVGGGNIGTQFAVHCAAKRHQVTIYSSKPECFRKRLSIVDEKGTITCEGDITEATNSAEKAFSDADIIFVTVPAFYMETISELIYPYVNKGVKIGLIPGTGGGECVFRKCLEKGAVLFGMQRVPSVARLTEYGRSVCAVGYRSELHIAAIPSKNVHEMKEIISSIFEMPCTDMPSYLSLTLTPSNPVLHTTRLKTLFKDYYDGITYASVPLFYEEWDDETSKLLFRLDDEVQQICKELREYDLSQVKSLKTHYESETPEQFTKKIAGIKGFKGLRTPMIKVKGRYVPDLHSRYFTSDFSYGLEIIFQIACLIGIGVPYMQHTLEWYKKIAIVKDKFEYGKFGINNKTDFNKFYQQ